MNVLELTLCDVAEMIRARRIGCEELLQECFARIAETDSKLNAVIALEKDTALARARDLDRMTGSPKGPLHGVPLGYKDMFHRKGAISTYGAADAHWTEAKETSALLGSLEKADAVGCARLHMAEFAMGPTGHNPTFGRCRNPHAPDRISGGSSSGSGAAVAAGYVFGALGSDTGGSVRLPAAICGIVGLKPTQYLLSTEGMMPLSSSLDCPGLLARSSRDVARMLDVLIATESEAALQGPIGNVRIGVPQSYYTDGLDEDVSAAFQSALSTFDSLEAKMVAVDVPDQTDLPHFADVLWKSEAAAIHRKNFAPGPKQLGCQARARLAQGLGVLATDYVDAQKLRVHALARMLGGPLAEADVLVMPTVPIMVPTAHSVSAEAGDKMRTTLEKLSRFTRPISFLGLPALSTPMGRDRNGLPIGLQIVGRPRAEGLLLRLGQSLADRIGYPA